MSSPETPSYKKPATGGELSTMTPSEAVELHSPAKLQASTLQQYFLPGIKDSPSIRSSKIVGELDISASNVQVYLNQMAVQTP